MRLKQIDRYEIVDEIGRGAMGVVYKARDPAIDRIVAIKTIGSGLSPAEFEAFEQRFEREARSAGRLNHPNIVTIYDVGKTGDTAYIAMEFLEGRSLREILDSGVVLPSQTVALIAAQIADGLAYAHQHGVVHRDIKPGNVMVLDSGNVKIMDFGIAKLPSGARTVAGPIFGSPKYISPERVVGREVDARSDIFSLGAVLYELLTGVPPFAGSDLDEILHHVINAKPTPPSKHNRSLPGAFDAIVERALAKHPNDRYQNATDLAADLRRIAQGGAESSRVPPSAPRPAQARNAATTIIVGSTPADDTVLIGARNDAAIAAALEPRRARGRVVRVFQDRRVRYAAIAVAVVLVSGGGWLAVQPGALAPAMPEPAHGAVRDAEPASLIAASLPAPELQATATSAPSSLEPASHSSDVKLEPSTRPPAVSVVAAAAIDPPAAQKPLGHIALAVAPWGEVYVDGRRRGVTPPLTELRLAPGKHSIEIRNTTFAPHTETVDVKPGSTLRVQHKFE